MDRAEGIGQDGGNRKIALLVQYDGTRFNGWQRQAEGRTVQEELEKALHVLLRERVQLTASGRTDTGVHACGQVVHFTMGSDIPLQRLCIGLNGILEEDVSVLNAYQVPESFHARYSALAREYLYVIYNNRQRSPFLVNRAMWISSPLDADYLHSAAQYLIGENDFASFCKRASSREGTIRRIEEIEVMREGDTIRIRIRGNAFLHNMVRIIVGTLLKMHREKARPEIIADILKKRDRNASGPTALAKGLYLHKVYYDPPLDTMEKAF